eukprot:GDKK01032864.1.p1 GENE.GDKK01032864.1~~GDKK01032864.1.p1  ORF type:complete len:636 (+),score=104.54 GDKK01032864.1:141-1910(+)
MKELVRGAVIACTWQSILYGNSEVGIARRPITFLKLNANNNNKSLDRLMRSEKSRILDVTDGQEFEHLHSPTAAAMMTLFSGGGPRDDFFSSASPSSTMQFGTGGMMAAQSPTESRPLYQSAVFSATSKNYNNANNVGVFGQGLLRDSGVYGDARNAPRPFVEGYQMASALLFHRYSTILRFAIFSFIAVLLDKLSFIESWLIRVAEFGPLTIRWILQGCFFVFIDRSYWLDEDGNRVKATKVFRSAEKFNRSEIVLPRYPTPHYSSAWINIEELNPNHNIFSWLRARFKAGVSPLSWSFWLFTLEDDFFTATRSAEHMMRTDRQTLHLSATNYEKFKKKNFDKCHENRGEHDNEEHLLLVSKGRNVSSPARRYSVHHPPQKLTHDGQHTDRFSNELHSQLLKKSPQEEKDKFSRFGAALAFAHAASTIATVIIVIFLFVFFLLSSHGPMVESLCQTPAVLLVLFFVISITTETLFEIRALQAETLLVARLIETFTIGSKKQSYQEGSVLTFTKREEQSFNNTMNSHLHHSSTTFNQNEASQSLLHNILFNTCPGSVDIRLRSIISSDSDGLTKPSSGVVNPSKAPVIF